MELYKILHGIEYSIINHSDDLPNISGINTNSKLITYGEMFVAIEGKYTDGHKFINDAIKNGAVCIVITESKRELIKNHNSVCIICVKNTRDVLSIIVDNFYDHPTERFKLVGITGTNGKTSVSMITKHILNKLGSDVGIIGTIDNFINDKPLNIRKTNPTTPDCIELGKIMDCFAQKKVDIVLMEVSSAALKYKRVNSCCFDLAVFTNISHDHLDEHGNMLNYMNEKRKLFDFTNQYVLNSDEVFANSIIKQNDGCEIIEYGINSKADVFADNIVFSDNNLMHFDIIYKNKKHHQVIDIPGKYVIYNILAAISICLKLGFAFDDIVNNLSGCTEIPGRYEILKKDNLTIIIDYAHTPVALENLLTTVHRNKKYKRIITVFGCTGNRDRYKRPDMVRIAQQLSDIIIFTSYDSMSELQGQIFADMLAGVCQNKPYFVIEDRKEAIESAVNMMSEYDVVVIAGKGHEKVQIKNGSITPFSDRDVSSECLGLMDIINV